MNGHDPLETLITSAAFANTPPAKISQIQEELHTGLSEVIQFLDNPPSKKANFADVGRQLFFWSHRLTTGFRREDIAVAEETYLRVFKQGGTGHTFTQESLLKLLSLNITITSISFWLKVIDLNKPRDKLAESRPALALAALAWLAIRQNEPEAYAALQQVMYHPQARIAGLAIYYLAEVYEETERPFPPELIAKLREIATTVTVFEPRFQARAALKTAKHPLPLDVPDGFYAFKVYLIGMKRVYRTVALRSDQTLETLHWAIQNGFGWDADHLYTFYLSGQKYDRHYAFACPFEDERPPWANQVAVGDLGLVKGQHLLYHFDYGDDHLFEVEVIDIQPETTADSYPRLVDQHGKSPSQYGW